MSRLALTMRLALGAALVFAGINHFIFELVPMPSGEQALAAQLLAAFAHSGLLDIAMAVLLVAGVLILAGLFVPLALCLVMPISTCAAYWAVILEGDLPLAVLTHAMLALNALLMLAYLDAYHGTLRRDTLALGDAPGDGMSFETTYARLVGGISPMQFAVGLLPLLAAAALYHFIVPSLLALYSLGVLAVPAAVLLVRLIQGRGGAK